MSFILYYPTKAAPTKTVTLPSPEISNSARTFRNQAVARTRGGQRRVYDKGIARVEASFAFVELTETQKADVDTFIDDYADGMSNAFQIEDYPSDLYDAWFSEVDLEWTNDGEYDPPDTDAFFSVTLNLEIQEAT